MLKGNDSQTSSKLSEKHKNQETRLDHENTVDGRNPAPVDMVNIAVFTGFYTSQLVQDFFHQQYHFVSGFPNSINRVQRSSKMTSSFVANDLEDSDAPSVAFRIAKYIILVQIPPSIPKQTSTNGLQEFRLQKVAQSYNIQ